MRTLCSFLILLVGAIAGIVGVSSPASAAGTGDIVGVIVTTAGTPPPSSGPFSSAYVIASRVDGEQVVGSYVASDGSFRIAALAPGTYRLRIGGPGIVTTIYGQTDAAPDGIDVVVTENLDTRLPQIVVSYTGVLTGKIVDQTGGTLKHSVTVVTYAVIDGVKASSSSWGTTVRADGTFTILNIQPGSYQLAADGSEYLPTWIGGTTDSETATTFRVDAGQTVQVGTTAVASGGSISGKVLTSAGQPSRNSTVAALLQVTAGEPQESASVQVDSAGLFRLPGLETGRYIVKVVPGNSWDPEVDLPTYVPGTRNLEEAAVTEVTRGIASTIASPITLRRGGSISGRITVASGSAANVDVTAHRYDPALDTWEFASRTTTNANGAYELVGLVDGAYRVSAGGYLFVQTWHGGDEPQNATAIDVLEAQTVPGIDIAARRLGQISGRVTDASGNRLRNVSVTAYRDGGDPQGSGWATTDGSGNYTLVGLEAGDYRLHFTPSNTPAGLSSVWFGPRAIDADDAQVLHVRNDEIIYDTNQVMAALPLVTGEAKDTAGRPVQGTLTIFQQDESGIWYPGNWVTSYSSGAFRLPLFSPGRYRLQFTSPGARPVWAGGGRTVATAATIELAAGETYTFDPVVIQIGTLSGTIVNDDGERPNGRVFGVRLWTVDPQTAEWVATAGTVARDGRYRLTGIDDEPYKIEITDQYSVYSSTWVGGTDLESATPIIGSSTGETVIPVVQMRSGRIIEATSTPSVDGRPIVGATITATAATFTPQPTTTRMEWRLDRQLVSTGATFVVPWDAEGKTLTVHSIGSAPDTRSGTADLEVGRVTNLRATGRLAITGSAHVGRRLAVSSGTWTVTPDRVTYQWMRSGRPITGATSASYVAQPADVSQAISVQVSASAEGYVAAQTQAVAVGPVTTDAVVKASAKPVGPGRVRVTGTVKATGVTSVAGDVAVYIGAKLLKRVALKQGRLNVQIGALQRGTRKLTVRFLGTTVVLPARQTIRVKVG